jgi:hypothetical protein
VIRQALFGMQPSETKEMGKKGRERVIREFSKDKMAERLEQELGTAPAFHGVGVREVLFFAAGFVALGMSVGLLATKQRWLF